jgi:hypothetical protein
MGRMASVGFEVGFLAVGGLLGLVFLRMRFLVIWSCRTSKNLVVLEDGWDGGAMMVVVLGRVLTQFDGLGCDVVKFGG